MSRLWKILLVISLLGNLVGIYVAIKALEYREHINEFLDKYTYVVDEFSCRNEYAEENRLLMEKPSTDRRVVFIGTQITSGWDLDRYFNDCEAINRGISGQRLAGYPLRFRSDVIALNPKAVVVEFSSYNFRPEYNRLEIQDYITTMVDLARWNKIEPVLTTVIPVGRDFDVETEVAYSVPDTLREYNKWLLEFSRENKLKLVDFYALVIDADGYLDPELGEGQILLTAAGYEKISSAANEISTGDFP